MEWNSYICTPLGKENDLIERIESPHLNIYKKSTNNYEDDYVPPPIDLINAYKYKNYLKK